MRYPISARLWWPTVVGGAIFLIELLLLPAALIARVTLLAPLVIVPRLLGMTGDDRSVARLAGWPSLVAAVPLVFAFGLPAGVPAALLSVPWLALCAAAALLAAWHAIPLLPRLLDRGILADAGVDAACGFLAVGAVFLAADRLGIQPLGFSTTIILLTGTHFHVAAFGLLLLTALLARRRPWLNASVVGLVVGFPITAAGFVLSSDLIGAVGALVVGAAGIGTGVAWWSDGGYSLEAWTKRIAGVALLAGMALGIAWSWSVVFGIGFIGLDLMVRTHGALNAGAVLLASLLGRWDRA